MGDNQQQKPTVVASNNNNNKTGMDTLISLKGKKLKVGETIKFTLIKGKTYKGCKDPVASSKKKQQPPKENFPMILKFADSVVKPNFTEMPWKKGRLYQQDVPKIQDDSDDETNQSDQNKKKRWRRRKVAPKRQFILQEETDFIETMIAKKQKKILPADRISTRYEGVVEHNSSHYVIMKVSSSSSGSNHNIDDSNTENHTIDVIPLPVNPVHAFQQPVKLKTLSMTEAEHAIEDQRGKMTRYMMHAKSKSGTPVLGGGPPISKNKARLLGKLSAISQKGVDIDDGDDVMGDVGFKSRKGTAAKARKELLTSLGDGVAVDDDGVLGGGNDAEFGGRQRFNRLNVDNSNVKDDENKKKDASGGGAGNDGMAMADDFYQRDVKAEYDEMDYDANEQFDDDDVDLGEAEVHVDNSGFAADNEDDDDDDDDEDDVGGGELDGVEGLASVAGFRKLLAKARGEGDGTANAAAAGAAAGEDASTPAVGADGTTTKMDIDTTTSDEKKTADDEKTTPSPTAGGDTTSVSPGVDALAEAAAKAKQAAEDKAANNKEELEERNKMLKEQPLLDENGQRALTLESVRREIWLHHGSMRMKRLMDIFEIKKKKKERLNKFRELIKELCTMKVDPTNGSMLILKQHYSNMG